MEAFSRLCTDDVRHVPIRNARSPLLLSIDATAAESDAPDERYIKHRFDEAKYILIHILNLKPLATILVLSCLRLLVKCCMECI